VSARIQPSDWSRSREKQEKRIFDQLLLDRFSGRSTRIRPGEPLVLLASLSIEQIAKLAKTRAEESLQRAVQKHEGRAAVLRRKAKRGEAA
jgi:hypothetical protein